MDWFLYDRDLRHERVKVFMTRSRQRPKRSKKLHITDSADGDDDNDHQLIS